mmetsp:Transcript_981/g.2444  ORF Transcript_981/g.2444 Transcript_981/m.2444 type:complete len:604 (-) Transcript_981:388-2199(-)
MQQESSRGNSSGSESLERGGKGALVALKMLEGYLTKWTNALTGWKRRYFILDDDKLSYCKNRGGKIKGTLNLSQSKVLPNSLYPARFKIFSGRKYMHLKAYSVEEARKWLAALLKKQPVVEIEHYEETKRPHSRSVQPKHHPSSRLSLNPDQLALTVTQLKHANDTILSLAKALQKTGPSAETLQHLVETAETSNAILSKVAADMILDDSHGSDCSDTSEEFYDAVEEDAVQIHRSKLPHQREPGQKLSIWKVIKDSIGKELSKISVPVYFNEPLSFIQRFSEELTYTYLLEEAAHLPDQAQRIAYVAAFASSVYCTSLNRTSKPFNPMLGETFELQLGKVRMVSEQVSHHPPVTALHAEHPEFKFWGSMQPTTKFKGTYIQVRCLGTMHVEFPHLHEHYAWEKPNSSVHNVVVGNIYIDHHGSFTVRDIKSPARAEIHFDKRGWLSASSRDVRAEIFDASGAVKYTLTGNWSTHLELHDLASMEDKRIWEVFPLPPDYEYNYFMTDFALQLNHPPECYPGLPQTDTRYRPDQRALENGDLDTAIAEKNRLEEKQRHAKRLRDESHESWSPMWFATLGGEWKYQGGYWERRASGQLDSLPDIF